MLAPIVALVSMMSVKLPSRPHEKRAATFDGLKSTASHLRSRVGKALQLQFAPEIAFRIDESIARAAHIETLLAGLREPLPPVDGTPDDRDG